MAVALTGERERAWKYYTMLDPVNHSRQPQAMELYQVEPSVMCADIYAAPPHSGRGGLTWETGPQV